MCGVRLWGWLGLYGKNLGNIMKNNSIFYGNYLEKVLYYKGVLLKK